MVFKGNSPEELCLFPNKHNDLFEVGHLQGIRNKGTSRFDVNDHHQTASTIFVNIII